jgi:DNA-directed RNA polymerase subunit RPC12/RpoP
VVCTNRKIVKGYNDIATTHPYIVNSLLDFNDGFIYSHGSGKKVNWECLDCGNIIKNKRIADIAKYGLFCPKCSDKISYSEKFTYNVLSQLNINFEYQKSFEWSLSKKYDFYIKDENIIIETHGEQHYVESFTRIGKKARNLKEEQENDKLKEKLALQNNINKYIAIDVKRSELEYIKNNILNSELFKLFDLSGIDWVECHKFACSSLVCVVCNLWNNEKMSTTQISKTIKLHVSTIIKYLKRGTELGLCDYSAKESSKIALQKTIKYIKDNISKKVIQLDKNNNFIKEYESISSAEKDMKINNISMCCMGKLKFVGGYKWVYSEYYHLQIKSITLTKT